MAHRRVLHSWKEIASYLNRGVRTVQRWEAELGMPVRRPRGKGRSAVIAMRSELDQWIKSCPTETDEETKPQVTSFAQFPMLLSLRASTLELHRLRDEMKFPNPAILKAQIQKDARRSLKFFRLLRLLAPNRSSRLTLKVER